MAEQVNIKDFLRKHELATKELKFDGFNAPFIIQEISNEANERLQKQATKVTVNRSGQRSRDIDQTKYVEAMLQEALIQPDLNNKELQEFYGTLADPMGTLNKMLTMGELNSLSQSVLDLSGLNESVDDEVEAVKK